MYKLNVHATAIEAIWSNYNDDTDADADDDEYEWMNERLKPLGKRQSVVKITSGIDVYESSQKPRDYYYYSVS